MFFRNAARGLSSAAAPSGGSSAAHAAGAVNERIHLHGDAGGACREGIGLALLHIGSTDHHAVVALFRLVGDKRLAARVLQWQAKKAMPFKDFLNGSRNFVGNVCGAAKN